MMTFNTSIFAAVFLVACLSGTASGLSCYECQGSATDVDKSCLDPFNPKTNTVKQRPCSEFGSGQFVCTKTVSESHTDTLQAFHGTVTRGCQRINSGGPALYNRLDLTSNTYLCETNLCNSSSIVASSILLLFLISLLSIVLRSL
ncbi:uncharacterized protein LOC129596062 [Paramacrobiotus metropolitanus]|uniref:uncharacterized protein LOC129596062 n=1 Tax=Paramacrobiotus metropolitanus TaxID=2943436 RepID=UPI002445BF4D|nr:uncharacterized protein LOC129596062 [Paramacrobiotus metropolitanus]